MQNYGEGFIRPTDENGMVVPGTAHIALTGNGQSKTGLVVLRPMEETSLAGRPDHQLAVDQPRVPLSNDPAGRF